MIRNLLLTFSMFLMFGAYAQTPINSNLISIQQNWDNIFQFDFIDTTDYSIIHSSSIAPPTNGDYTFHGAFWSQMEEKLFFIMDSIGYIGDRHMYELDLYTNSFEKVLDIGGGEYWADVTMTTDNRLFGITANNSNTIPPRTFCEIDRTTGAITQLFNVSIPTITAYQKSALAYNTDDESLYLVTCGDSPVDTSVLFKINPTSLTVDTIEMSQQFSTMLASHYLGDDEFLLYTWNTDSFHIMNTNGNISASHFTLNYTSSIAYFNILKDGDSFCANEELELESIASNQTYAWTQDGASLSDTSSSITVDTAGTYQLTLTTDSFIFAQSVDVNTLNVPNVNLSPGDSTICADSTIILMGSNGGSSQWYLNGTAIAGATLNTYETMTAGVYNMTKTNLNGCSDSASVGITIVVQDCDTIIDNIRELNTTALSIYPNPASKYIHIDLAGFNNTNSSISIYNLIGNEISVHPINNSTSINLNVEKLVTGFYFVRIHNEEVTHTAKFYKK